MSDVIFRKIKKCEVEFAKQLVKKAFPHLKYVNTMKRSGSDVFYFNKFKISLTFPNDCTSSYDVEIVQYLGRWFYQVTYWQCLSSDWSNVQEIVRWIHPDTDEVYDDKQIVIDEYRTMPYLNELKERHGM